MHSSDLTNHSIQLRQSLSRALGWFWDFLLPASCLSCRTALQGDCRLCSECWQKLELIAPPLCDRLGVPFAFDPGGEALISVAALQNPPKWNRARAATRFDPHSRKLVHALKYHDRHEATQLMAMMMWQAGRDVLQNADALVPVPLHDHRLLRRRFNQSALLCREISQHANISIYDRAVRRIRPTAQQVGLDRQARKRNVSKAFQVPGDHLPQVAGKRLVVVDDVMTTGATAGAVAEVLTKAGAENVDVLAFALVCDGPGHHM